MNHKNFILLLLSLGWVTIFYGPTLALAQVAPALNVLERFGALGAAGVTGQAGNGAAITGDVGSSPNPAISNFPPSTVVPPFVLHLTSDAVVQQAQVDATNAYNALAAQGPGTVLADNLTGVVLTSGIYSFATGAPNLPAGATLTLNGPGIFVFNVDSTLTANVLSNVVGTANSCNVYWRVGSSATLNGNTFRGNVIALASVTVGDIVGPLLGQSLTGRVVARTGAVTMPGDGGTSIGGCSAAGSGSVASNAPIPTLTEWNVIILALFMVVAGWVVLRKQLFL